MNVRKQLALAAVGVALVATLAGCGSAEQKPASHVVQAASGFMETEKVDGLDITLAIDPVVVGENRFIVTVSDQSVTAADVQVIMATMGHGQIVELKQAAPGRFEVNSDAINMEGKWMLRVNATLASGPVKTATFYTNAK